jgi:hypothetical protein
MSAGSDFEKYITQLITMKHLAAAGIASAGSILLAGQGFDAAAMGQAILTYGGPTIIGCTVGEALAANMDTKSKDENMMGYLIKAAIAGGVGVSVLMLAGVIPVGLDTQTVMAAGLIGGSCVLAEQLKFL